LPKTEHIGHDNYQNPLVLHIMGYGKNKKHTYIKISVCPAYFFLSSFYFLSNRV